MPTRKRKGGAAGGAAAKKLKANAGSSAGPKSKKEDHFWAHANTWLERLFKKYGEDQANAKWKAYVYFESLLSSASSQLTQIGLICLGTLILVSTTITIRSGLQSTLVSLRFRVRRKLQLL